MYTARTATLPALARRLLAMLALAIGCAVAQADDGATPTTLPGETVTSLASQLAVGDVVFIRVPFRPFRQVASATGSWTNHVGIVTALRDGQPVISESAVPWSRQTSLARFAARSDHGRLAVYRLGEPLTGEQQKRLADAAEQRMGVWYDTGFNLHSANRQFCSRFVREVLLEATGTPVGQVQTFADMLAEQPSADLGFWKLWYFGHIPWQRQTVTPASLLHSPALHPVFDGRLTNPAG
jgi:hypothetical protein